MSECWSVWDDEYCTTTDPIFHLRHKDCFFFFLQKLYTEFLIKYLNVLFELRPCISLCVVYPKCFLTNTVHQRGNTPHTSHVILRLYITFLLCFTEMTPNSFLIYFAQLLFSPKTVWSNFKEHHTYLNDDYSVRLWRWTVASKTSAHSFRVTLPSHS